MRYEGIQSSTFSKCVMLCFDGVSKASIAISVAYLLTFKRFVLSKFCITADLRMKHFSRAALD